MPFRATGGGGPPDDSNAQHGAPKAIKKKQTQPPKKTTYTPPSQPSQTATQEREQQRQIQQRQREEAARRAEEAARAAARRAAAAARADAERRAAAARAAALAKQRASTPRVPTTKLPEDPVGASLSPVRDIQGGGGGASAQAAETERERAQKAARTEYLRRADPDYDPATQGRRAARRGGTDARVYGSTDTELLLNSIGYTGNGQDDFNQTVERVNKVFKEQYGEEPTPAFVLDLVRSPAAQDQTSLRALFSGTSGQEIDPYQGATQLDVHRFGLTPMTEEQKREASYKRAIASSVLLSVYSGQDLLTTAVTGVVMDKNRLHADQITDLVNDPNRETISVRAVQLQSALPVSIDQAADIVGLPSWLQRYGVQGQVSGGNTYEQNQRIIDAAIASHADETTAGPGSGVAALMSSAGAKNGLAATRQIQLDLKRLFPKISLPASGIIDKRWADLISRYQTNKSYSLIGVIQRARDAGFGNADPYGAVNTQTSEYSDTPDGRAAEKMVGQYQGALKRREYAIEHNSLGRRIYENMPLQAFANDGIADGQGAGAIDLGLGTFDYILGGSDFALTEHHGLEDIALDVPNIAEKGLIRGVTTAFGATNGLLQQVKSDLYASEAFRTQGDWSDMVKKAQARLRNENPSWLNLVFNDPNARGHLAGYLQSVGVSEDASKGVSNWTDFGSNIALDVMVTKRFGWGGGGDFGRAAKGATLGDNDFFRALLRTDPRVQESIGLFTRDVKDGKAASALEHLGGADAASAVGRRDFIVKYKTLERGLMEPTGEIEFAPLADDVYKQGRLRNVANEPGHAPEGHVPAESEDTGMPRYEHPLQMPEWIDAENAPTPPDLTQPPPIRPVEGGQAGGLRNRIAQAGPPEPPAAPEAPGPTGIPEDVRRAMARSGEWIDGAPTGKVGAGAEFQLHRGLEFANGRKVDRIIIRQPSTTTPGLPANVLHADIEPGGIVRVKHIVTIEPERGMGHGTNAYTDLFAIADELGGTRIVRDFSQSPEAKRMWSRSLRKVADRMGWHYVEGKDYADTAWNVDNTFSYAQEAYPTLKAAKVKNADLGYFQRDGTDLGTMAEQRAEARARAAAERANTPDPVAVSEQPGRRSLIELIEEGRVDDEFVRDEIERHAAGRRVFNNLAADWSVPYTRRNIMPHSWQHPLWHPIHGTRMRVWEAAGRFLDHVDMTYYNSPKTEAGGLLRAVTRNVREQFTRAANWREIPVEAVDPKNVERLALRVGMDIDHARALSRRWILAIGNNNPVEWNAIRNEIGAAAIAQGRDGTARALGKAFAAAIDRRAERGIWEKAFKEDPDSVFGSGGLVDSRQWASLEAVTGEHVKAGVKAAQTRLLKREIEKRGLRWIEQKGVYKGESNPSLFVPGLSQSEAIDIGRMFNQETIATNKGLFGAADHVWNPETLKYDTPNEYAGKLVPSQGVIHGPQARKLDGYSDTPFGDVEHAWSMDLNWDGAREVTAEDLRAAYMGETYIDNQKLHLEEQTRRTQDPEERGILDDMAANAKNTPSPIMPTQMMQNFSVPELGIPKTPKNFAQRVLRMNDGVLRLAAINRRMILVTDPILFFKHLTADTARRILAEGGIKAWANARQSHGVLEKYLLENPEEAGRYNALRNLRRNGELRFDVEGKGHEARGPSEAFDTLTAVEEATKGTWGISGRSGVRLGTAAEYIDHRLMDGAAQAWRVRGSRDDLIDFLKRDPKGRALVESEGLSAERMAGMLDENLKLIHAKDPSFLEDAEAIRNQAVARGEDSRKAIAKWLVKERRSIPVVGHGKADDVLNFARRLDDIGQKTISAYLTFNKWNRDGLFYDMTAKHFDDFVKAGYDEKTAFTAAMGVAGKITRYHMLDLADALTVEQTLRWSAYFFTKHRLYWSWLASTLVHKPYLAIALQHARESLYAQSDPNDPTTQGKITFNMPDFLPGVVGAGGRIKYTIPVARLFWMLESQGQPGAIAMAEHALTQGNFEDAIPFTKGAKVELTTIDSALKTLALMGAMRAGRVHGSDGVESHLNPTDTFKFRQVYNRIQFSYMQAHNGQSMSDADATSKALHHMFITMFWRGSGITGGYIEDPNRSGAQEKIWKQYNDSLDPREREKLRNANPWLESMIGVGYSSPRQHTLSRKLWAEFQDMMAVHENRQDALLRSFHKTGNPNSLFGAGWRNESDRFNKAFDDFKARAKGMGATDWVSTIDRDPFLGFTQTFDATLHDLYPGMDEAIVKKLTGTVNPAWVNQYRTALDTNLSDQGIAKLPPDLQSGAYVMRSFYRQQLSDYNSAPDTDAEKVRRNYFDKVYGPYQEQLGKFFDQVALAGKGQKGNVYDKMLAFKIANDHDTTLGGYTFPSAERTHWVFLPKEAQYLSNEGNLTKQWGWLTPFEKERLGVKTTPQSSTGWLEFNRIQNEHENQTARHSPSGTPDYFSDEQRLALAKKVDKAHPGFYKDYLYGLQPVYVRAQEQGTFGATPHAKKGWKEWLGKVNTTASLLVGGPPHPPVTRPDLMLMWNKMFNKTIFDTLMYRGLPGVDGGRPAGGRTGYLYREALASPNQEFRAEFENAYNDDADLIVKMFGTGG